MKQDLPIGIFDSGLGGLTIVKAVHELLPQESIIYFGDTAHLPYGDKSPELITRYSSRIAEFLVDYGVKAIIIACNTASAVAYDAVVKAAGNIPVLDVIRPAARLAVARTQNNQLGVIGTKTTINSGVYSRTIAKMDSAVRVLEKPTPLLVPLIEEGWLNNAISQEVIEAYLSDTGFYSIDTLILGCTHYPLIKAQVEQYFQENFRTPVYVVDSSVAVAEQLKRSLSEQGILYQGDTDPHHEYYVSDLSSTFEDSAKLFLKKRIRFRKPVM